MTIKLDIRPEIQLLSRNIALHRVIDELATSLGATEESLKTIRKGVLERQILSDVIFCYICRDAMVGRISISIDWDKHQILAETEEGRAFLFNTSESIAKQISGIFPVLAQHAESLRSARKVDKVSVWYRYRSDIRNDSEKLKEARSFLGLLPENMPEWAKRRKFGVKLEFTAKRLAELGIKIEHGKE